MRTLPQPTLTLTLLTTLPFLLVVAPAQAGDPIRHVKETIHDAKRLLLDNKNPMARKTPSVENVAREIDWLEHLIETYGTVVPKHPDVWGEARLTRYRDEYERELAKKFSVGEFDRTLQGAIRRSDQSLLSVAFSLNAAIGTGGSQQPNNNSALSLIQTPIDGNNSLIARLPTVSSPAPTPAGSSNPSRFFPTGDTFRLEPVIETQQLSRYLKHLNHLRRINEGDDTADSPGYALNLMRIPVSVLPGKRTRKGYGAEIAFTAEPYLSDDLLPSTMRSLIIKDVADQNALPLARLYNNDPDKAEILLGQYVATKRQVSNWMLGFDRWLGKWEQYNIAAQDPDVLKTIQYLHGFRDYLHFRFIQIAGTVHYLQKGEWSQKTQGSYTVEDHLSVVVPVDGKEYSIIIRYLDLAKAFDVLFAPQNELFQVPLKVFYKAVDEKDGKLAELPVNVGMFLPPDDIAKFSKVRRFPIKPIEEIGIGSPKGQDDGPRIIEKMMTRAVVSFFVETYTNEISQITDAITQIPYSQFELLFGGSRAKRALRPLTASQYTRAYGFDLLFNIAVDQRRNLQMNPANSKTIHLLDIRRNLTEELNSAYRMLCTQENVQLWSYCTPDLARAVRSYNHGFVTKQRKAFLDQINAYAARETQIGGLAWAIIVEAALLNDRLVEQINRTALAKGCACLNADGMQFVGPREVITSDAQETFKQYVECRWPVVVFALDPTTDDQNIADVFSRRRELQLAVAVAVSTGEVSPNVAGRFVRRLEADIETIALNRTSVAFSHGNDTFGWRFYPRVQTPDTPGTLGAFGQTLFGGPNRDRDLRDRQLEPAIRECSAIVIMPSFVPYLMVESRANWFKLTNPESKELTLHDTMRISRNYQKIRSTMHACNSRCYRPGDIAHLSRVMDQLDRRMPLQHKMVQIPHENTLGGTDLFEQGVTSLGPQLDGWYGAPGIDPHGVTTLFLVGDKFSVHETRVIAGGRSIPFRLVSRELMEVTIPPGVQTLNSEKFGHFVDVQLMTPYGPTSHLMVPIASRPAKQERFAWATSAYAVDLHFTATDNVFTPNTVAVVATHPPQIRVATPTLAAPTTLPISIVVTEQLGNGQLVLSQTTPTARLNAQLDPRTRGYVLDVNSLQDLLTTAFTERVRYALPANGQKARWLLRGAVHVQGAAADPILSGMALDVTFRRRDVSSSN